jgi:hypothetical protein
MRSLKKALTYFTTRKLSKGRVLIRVGESVSHTYWVSKGLLTSNTKSFGGMVFSGTYAQCLEGGTTARGPVTIGDGYSPSMIYDITAESDVDGITLAWRSGSEVEVNYYHIHRSVDGVNFEQIGKVDGRGSRKQKLFSFVDAKHPGGTIHYRVDLMSVNGVGSPVATIDITAGSVEAVAPTPSDKSPRNK